jgi:hydrogenase-4 membrane subunit HyfE
VTYLLAGFALALAAPLLLGGWRLALLGLSAQALLVAAMLAPELGAGGGEGALAAAVALLDVVAVRALVLPGLLGRVARRTGAPAALDLLPGNAIAWGLGGGVVLLGASFGARVAPPGDTWAAVHLAVSASQVLLGLLILSFQQAPLGQAIGALTVENGVLVLEAGSSHHLSAGVQAGVAAVLVGFVLLSSGFVRRSLDPAAAPAPGGEDGDLL